MAKYIGQISGTFYQNYDLLSNINPKADRVIKIGIQLANDYYAIINNEIYEMGKTGILEFDNVEITKLTLRHKYDKNKTKVIPVIVDYICEIDR